MDAVINYSPPTDVSTLATFAKQDAAEVTRAAILAKLPAAPALDATTTAGNVLLTAIKALLPSALVSNRLDVNIGASSATVPISGAVTTSGTTTATLGTTDAAHLATIDTSTASTATSTSSASATLTSILTKIIAAPSTAANQSTIITALGALATQATVAAILAALPATLGQKTPALSLATVQAVASTAVAATCAATGVVIKASPGTAYSIVFRNTTGGAVYWQIHDAAAAGLTVGALPVVYATASLGTGSQTSANIGGNTFGGPCQTKIILAFSSTPDTFTSTGSANVSYTVVYI